MPLLKPSAIFQILLSSTAGARNAYVLAMNSIKQDEQAKKHKQDKEIAEKVEKYNETHK